MNTPETTCRNSGRPVVGTPRARRASRILTWAGLVFCSLIIVVWALSTRYALTHGGRQHIFMVEGGGISISTVSADPPNFGWGVHKLQRPVGPAFSSASIRWPRIIWESNLWLVAIPFWLILVCIGIPTACFWRLDRRRHGPDSCQQCGYDLTGNVSGRCPECGTPT